MATLTKEEFIKEIKAKEQAAYSILSEQTDKIMRDEKTFKSFLNMLADHVTSSVGNTILVQAQKPNATAVNSIDEWGNRNISVKKDDNGYYPQGIYQFMADGYRVDENGEAHTRYKVYKGYDAEQTSSPEYARLIMNEARPVSVFVGSDAEKTRNIALCDSSIIRCMVYDPKKLIDDAENISEKDELRYIPETKTVIIRKVPRSEWFQRVSFEIALGIFHKEDGSKFSRTARSFEAGIMAYLLCRKSGVDVSNFHFDLSNLTSRYPKQEDFRAMLNKCLEESQSMFFRLQQKLKEHNAKSRSSVRDSVYIS